MPVRGDRPREHRHHPCSPTERVRTDSRDPRLAAPAQLPFYNALPLPNRAPSLQLPWPASLRSDRSSDPPTGCLPSCLQPGWNTPTPARREPRRSSVPDPAAVPALPLPASTRRSGYSSWPETVWPDDRSGSEQKQSSAHPAPAQTFASGNKQTRAGLAVVPDGHRAYRHAPVPGSPSRTGPPDNTVFPDCYVRRPSPATTAESVRISAPHLPGALPSRPTSPRYIAAESCRCGPDHAEYMPLRPLSSIATMGSLRA